MVDFVGCIWRVSNSIETYGSPRSGSPTERERDGGDGEKEEKGSAGRTSEAAAAAAAGCKRACKAPSGQEMTGAFHQGFLRATARVILHKAAAPTTRREGKNKRTAIGNERKTCFLGPATFGV